MSTRSGRSPVYEGLVEDLRRAIRTGTLTSGEQLPSEAALVRNYGISRTSVRLGLSLLAKDGLIRSVPGRGSFATTGEGYASSRRITMIVPDPGETLCALIVAGASREAMERGWEVVLSQSSEDPGLEQLAISRSIARKDDGIIIFPSDKRRAPDGLALLRESGTPTILVDRSVPGFGFDVVESDHRAGAYKATAHLIRLGHRSLAFLTTDNLTTSSVAERLTGFREALRESSIVFQSRHLWFACSPMSPEERESIKSALLDSHRPTAVFAVNDVLASELIAFATAIGVPVPSGLSVVGFDGLERTAQASGLTTVRQPAEEIGATAVQMLAERLDGRITGPGRVRTLQVALVEGTTATTAAVVDSAGVR